MDDDETLTAYHEAGHAVVAYALGATIESMQLGGEAEEWLPARFGECRVNWGRVSPHGDWQRQRELLTVLAGPAAEMVYCQQPLIWGEWHRGEHAASWEDDLQRAVHLAGALSAPSAAGCKRGETVLQPDAALRPTRQLLRLAMQSLDRHLRRDECWAGVAAVADELLAHELLEWDQLVDVLRFWIGQR